MSEINKLNKMIDDNFGNYISGFGFELKQQIFKTVNEHDALVAEVERLTQLCLKGVLVEVAERTLVKYAILIRDYEKVEAEVAKAKKLIDRILYAHKEGIIHINRGSNLTSHILAEAAEGLFWEAKKFIEEKNGEG